jgi:hypothetical protein
MNDDIVRFCSGCRRDRFEVRPYYPDDTVCVWSVCRRCRDEADALCQRHRLSAGVVDHGAVLDILRAQSLGVR